MQFTIKITDNEKIKLKKLSKWLDVSMTQILKQNGLRGTWEAYVEIMDKYDSYNDYLNR